MTDRAPTPKLRVLVSAFACCPPGARVFEGGEDLLGWRVISQLARFYEVWVITQPRKQGAIEAVRRHLLGDTVRFQYVRLPRWCEPWLRVRGLHQLYYYFWQIRAWLSAVRLHRHIRFHVMHHVTYANDWMASFAGALLPIPYIRGPGGGAHRVPARFLSEFSLDGRLWECVRVIGQWLFRRDPVFIIGQQRARAILVCNREAMAAVPVRWRGKSRLFPVNGIDDEELRWLANAVERGNAHFNVLFAGRLSRIKGTSLALKAFKEFSDKHSEAEFTVIGDGADAKSFEQLITSLGLEGRVRLLPWMPRQRFLDALRRCDVFLFPSLRDGGGAVVIEAMAAGKPVVCLDLGGPGMHVQDGCGMKIPARWPSQVIREIAMALEELWGDKSLRDRLGRAARTRIESSYRWNHLGERLRDVYEEAVRCRVHGDSVR
jgi:glycosyltransferase involved in cell wall biosynthesis